MHVSYFFTTGISDLTAPTTKTRTSIGEKEFAPSQRRKSCPQWKIGRTNSCPRVISMRRFILLN